MNEILCSDSREMNELRDSEVDLLVTSPYYRNAIDYEAHLSQGWYRGKVRYTLDEYLNEMHKHFREAYRVVKDGGFCCVVIGNEIDTEAKVLQPLPSYFTVMMTKDIGWRLHEEIVWYKVTGGKKRFKVTIKNPYPTYYYPNLLHESILVFRKGAKIHRREEKNRLVINEIAKKEVANSVWHITPVPPKFVNHPCPFPEQIPYRLILLYSNVGDLVLDNFNGSGTTTKVAYNLNREFVGYDIVEDYCETARNRLCSDLNLRNPLMPVWKKSAEHLTAAFQVMESQG